MRTILHLALVLFFISSSCIAKPPSFEPFAGRLSPQRFTPKYSAEHYFTMGENHLNQQKYQDAVLCFGVILHHFSDHTLYAQALYLTGVSYFKNNQPDLANKAFSAYMLHPQATYSNELFTMKFAIAQSFAQGKKKHMFLLEGFPKVVNADEDALRIYDEVLTAFPDQDLGAQSLYYKAELLIKRKEFPEAIKTLKKLTLQFSQHELSPQSFVRLAEIYLKQAKEEPQNTQYLQLAKMNASSMRKQHPNHPLNATITQHMRTMCDLYATSLYASGRFYEKKKKTKAAHIYYTTAVENYPESSLVAKCQKRLDRIEKRS